MLTLDGKTLADYAIQINDIQSLGQILQDLNDRKIKFIHGHDIKHVIKRYKPQYKPLIDKIFMAEAIYDINMAHYFVNGIVGHLQKPTIIQT